MLTASCGLVKLQYALSQRRSSQASCSGDGGGSGCGSWLAGAAMVTPPRVALALKLATVSRVAARGAMSTAAVAVTAAVPVAIEKDPFTTSSNDRGRRQPKHDGALRTR